MNQHEVKMINVRTVRQYCKNYTQIENYKEAVNDKSQTWICHHILGEILSSECLKKNDFYYDVPPCMLKFVTKSEHSKIHKKSHAHPYKKSIRKLSEETRKKISESCKGRKFSAETRKKISEANKRRKLSAETRKKLSEALKERVPWNKKSKV